MNANWWAKWFRSDKAAEEARAQLIALRSELARLQKDHAHQVCLGSALGPGLPSAARVWLAAFTVSGRTCHCFEATEYYDHKVPQHSIYVTDDQLSGCRGLGRM